MPLPAFIERVVTSRGSLMRFEGTRPANLGVDANGRLAPCPDTPNCVHSQRGQGRHAIEPLRITGNAQAAMGRARNGLRGNGRGAAAGAGSARAAMARLHEIVAGMRGANLVTVTNSYLYAEFRSRVFGFVDDVEFVYDRRAGVIHLRSASRLRRWDLGTNRRRIEAIRRRFGDSR